jgi:hypothetical protein
MRLRANELAAASDRPATMEMGETQTTMPAPPLRFRAVVVDLTSHRPRPALAMAIKVGDPTSSSKGDGRCPPGGVGIPRPDTANQPHGGRNGNVTISSVHRRWRRLTTARERMCQDIFRPHSGAIAGVRERKADVPGIDVPQRHGYRRVTSANRDAVVSPS